MKLQPASRREVRRIFLGCAVCCAVEIAGFLLLSLAGILKFNYTIITGSVVGSLVAVANFTMMCLMVQNAVATDDEKQRRTRVKGSYNLRRTMQILWLIAAYFLPCFHVIAAALPLLFPTAVIFVLQATGRLVTPSDRTGTTEILPEEPADEPGPFEV